MTTDEQTLLLQTGRFGIYVDCQESPGFYSLLKERFTDFLSDGAEVKNTFYISVLPPQVQTGKPENKIPVFTKKGAKFSPPGWEGGLDFFQKTGWVRPASAQFIEEIDYFLRVVCAVQAFQTGGLLFHAAGIIREGKAFVFFGPSGAGKTTVARLSGQENVLNDDLILLFPDHPGWSVYSTPFCNTTQITPSGNRYAPLGEMYRLFQDPHTHLEFITSGQALAEVVANVPVISANAFQMNDLLAQCQSLLDEVPVFRLHFRKDVSFWEVIENSQGRLRAGSPNNKNVSITSRTPS